MEKGILALPSSSKTPLAAADNQSREMGAQLTEQYERFGAMMMQLREHIIRTKSTETTAVSKILPRGRGSEDGGVTGWLGRFAPTVAPSNARRFESVAIAAANLWDGLPDTLAKKIEFPDLVTLEEKKLAKIDRRLPKKQKEVFQFAQGQSQKGLLDQFVDKFGGGGWRGKKGKRRQISQAQLAKLLRESWSALGGGLDSQTKEQTFRFLTDAELDALLEILSATETAIRHWRKKPITERDAISRAALAAALKGHK
jgi:hypothetical protein